MSRIMFMLSWVDHEKSFSEIIAKLERVKGTISQILD